MKTEKVRKELLELFDRQEAKDLIDEYFNALKHEKR